MNFKQNMSVQGLLTIFQGLNLTMLPGKIQLYAGIACQVIALLAGLRAQKFNSDGTPETVAYRPASSDPIKIEP